MAALQLQLQHTRGQDNVRELAQNAKKELENMVERVSELENMIKQMQINHKKDQQVSEIEADAEIQQHAPTALAPA